MLREHGENLQYKKLIRVLRRVRETRKGLLLLLISCFVSLCEDRKSSNAVRLDGFFSLMWFLRTLVERPIVMLQTGRPYKWTPSVETAVKVNIPLRADVMLPMKCDLVTVVLYRTTIRSWTTLPWRFRPMWRSGWRTFSLPLHLPLLLHLLLLPLPVLPLQLHFHLLHR